MDMGKNWFDLDFPSQKKQEIFWMIHLPMQKLYTHMNEFLLVHSLQEILWTYHTQQVNLEEISGFAPFQVKTNFTIMLLVQKYFQSFNLHP